jgi:AraC-like DNA-binding protein
MESAPVPTVAMDLTTPPEVVNQGRGTHGVTRLEDRFQLPELWSLHLYGYHAGIEVDGRRFAITPGTVSLVPPASVIRYHYRGPSTHLYAHLRAAPADPVRPGGHRPGGRLQMIMSPGSLLPVISDLMESAVVAAPTRPARTRADIWSALLRLDDRPLTGRSRPAEEHLLAAMSFIESRLPDSLSVPEVAAAVGISSNHLARVFAAELSETVVGYIRRRRVDHGRQLLASSTMSIAAIAASVGFPDLQAFNKACRTVTGLSPRQLRGSGSMADRTAPGDHRAGR